MARELKPLTDTEGVYIDDNTVVGYDYINQEYYVKNLDTTTVANSALDAKRIFDITAPGNIVTVEQIEALSTTLENITSVSYTLEDNGRYIKTISFNDYADLAMQYNEPYLFIRGTNEMWDMSSTIGADSVSTFMWQFYSHYVGLNMNRLLMDAIINYYRKLQNPYVYNVIATQTEEEKEDKKPLLYTNQLIMNNANGTSRGEYTCTKNPNGIATLNTYNVINATSGTNVITCDATPECDEGDVIQLTSANNHQDNLIVHHVFGNNIYTTENLINSYDSSSNAKVYIKAYGIIKSGYDNVLETTNALQIQSITNNGKTITPMAYITANSYKAGETVYILDKPYIISSVVSTTEASSTAAITKGYITLQTGVSEYISSNYTATYSDPIMMETRQNNKVIENSFTLSTILNVSAGDEIEVTNSGEAGMDGIYTVNYTENNKVFVATEDNKELPEYTFPANNKAMIQFRKPSEQILLNMSYSKRPDKVPLGEFMLDNDNQLTQYLDLRYITPPTPQNYACINSTVIQKQYLGDNLFDSATTECYMNLVGLYSDVYSQD